MPTSRNLKLRELDLWLCVAHLFDKKMEEEREAGVVFIVGGHKASHKLRLLE